MSSRVFMFFQVCIHYFKMNSYFKMNRDYRLAYKKLKESSPSKKLEKDYKIADENESHRFLEVDGEILFYSERYPENVNYKEFMTYMLYPTFTYQDKYPISKERSWTKIIFRFILILFAIVSANTEIVTITLIEFDVRNSAISQLPTHWTLVRGHGFPRVVYELVSTYPNHVYGRLLYDV